LAIDYGNIDAGCAVQDSELIKHQGIAVAPMSELKPAPDTLSHIAITH